VNLFTKYIGTYKQNVDPKPVKIPVKIKRNLILIDFALIKRAKNSMLLE
jgi:hypothetical protein